MTEPEILFENKYVADKDMVTEYVRRVLCKNTVAIALGLGIATIAFAVYNFIKAQTVYGILFAVLGVALVVLGSFLVPVMVKKSMQPNTAKKNAKKLKKRTTVLNFYESLFTLQEGTFGLKFDYHRVYRVYDLQYSYVLMFTRANGIMVKKDAFTKNGGDFEQFKEFIARKCDRAVMPK